MRELSRICGIRNTFTSLIEFYLKHELQALEKLAHGHYIYNPGNKLNGQTSKIVRK